MFDLLREREKKLFSVLVKREKPLTIKQLAEQFLVSSRTIRNDLEKLKKSLGTKEGIKVVTKPGVGVWLEVNAEYKQNLQNHLSGVSNFADPFSPESRRKFILKRLLEAEDRCTMQELADELYVSRTTIYNDLEEVEDRLKSYGLSLTRRKSYGIKIEGSEKKQRKAIADLLAEYKDEQELREILQQTGEEASSSRLDNRTYRDLKSLFSGINFHQIEVILEEAEEEMEFLFTDKTFTGLIVHIGISLKRLAKDKDIEMEANQLNKLREKDEFEIARFIAGRIEEELGVKIPEEELGYISLHILGAKFQRNIEQIEVDDVLEEADPMVVNMAREIIRITEEVLGVNLSGDRELLLGLVLHLRPAINRLQHGMSLRNPMLDKIKDNYFNVFGAAWASSIVFENYLDIEVTEEEIGYIALHLGAALERKKQQTKALIVCGSGLGTSQLLATKLKKRLSGLLVEGVVAAHNLTEGDLEKVDVIISTIPLMEDYSLPVIEISSLGTEEDINLIQQKVSGLVKKESKSDEITVEEIKNLVSRETIFVNQNLKNKEEVIEFLGKKLLKQGAVGSGFVDAVLEREQKTATEVGEGIALPHGDNQQVLASQVAITTLEESITWDEREVKIIFLLALKSRAEAEVFFRNYLQVVETEGSISRIKKASSSGEILEVFLDR